MPEAFPGDVWSFAGVNLQNDTLRCTTIDGYTAVPPMRGTGFVRSAVPGEMFRGKIHGARVLGLGLELFTRTKDRLSIHQNLDILAKAFNTQYQTEQSLVQFHPDGTVRTAMAHCVGWNPKTTDDHTGVAYTGVAEFLLSDPYFYTPAVTVTSPPGGGAMVINNPGTVRTHKILITFHGAHGVYYPAIVNNTNSLFVQEYYSNAANHTVTIDCYAFTALIDASNGIGQIYHGGDLPFMVFEPGNNSISVNGLTSTDTCDITYYPAYI